MRSWGFWVRPSVPYDDFDVADGPTGRIARLLLDPRADAAERNRVRTAILCCCEPDTAVLVAITAKLQGVARPYAAHERDALALVRAN